MMAERRVVVLRDVEGAKRKPKLRAALLRYLGRPAPETVLVLVQGAGEETEDKEIVRQSSAVGARAAPGRAGAQMAPAPGHRARACP